MVGLWDPSLEFVALDSTVWSVFMMKMMEAWRRQLPAEIGKWFSSIEKTRPKGDRFRRLRAVTLGEILEREEAGLHI